MAGDIATQRLQGTVAVTKNLTTAVSSVKKHCVPLTPILERTQTK